MKLHPVVFVAALLLTVGAGFAIGVFVQSRHPLVVVNAPALPDVNLNPLLTPDTGPNAKTLAKKAALLDYLDGKELKNKEKKPIIGANQKPLVFRKDGITAVQFSDTAFMSGNKPWSTTVTVLATADGKRYAVHADLEYRTVEDAIVIVSFTPTEVSPQ